MPMARGVGSPKIAKMNNIANIPILAESRENEAVCTYSRVGSNDR